jgi:hypothetical protein
MAKDKVQKPEAAQTEAKLPNENILLETHQDLVQKCEASGVKGVDWRSLLQQYGPALLQIFLQIVQKSQTLEARQGVTGRQDTPDSKVQCGEDDLKTLDECIDNHCAALCKLVEHRCKCECGK